MTWTEVYRGGDRRTPNFNYATVGKKPPVNTHDAQPYISSTRPPQGISILVRSLRLLARTTQSSPGPGAKVDVLPEGDVGRHQSAAPPARSPLSCAPASETGHPGGRWCRPPTSSRDTSKKVHPKRIYQRRHIERRYVKRRVHQKTVHP